MKKKSALAILELENQYSGLAGPELGDFVLAPEGISCSHSIARGPAGCSQPGSALWGSRRD